MLTLSPEKICYIIVKAREFDAKVDPVNENAASNPGDEQERIVLEDFADDPTYEELVAAIEQLNTDEMAELVGLMWLGRGDFSKEEWQGAVHEAKRQQRHTAEYLTGTPMLGDFLEEGLAAFGKSCEEFEMGHL